MTCRRCADPHEYISSLLDLFSTATFFERWLEHYKPSALEHAQIYQMLHRVAKFFYEVVCAFVADDLDGLLSRHMRKSCNGFTESKRFLNAE